MSHYPLVFAVGMIEVSQLFLYPGKSTFPFLARSPPLLSPSLCPSLEDDGSLPSFTAFSYSEMIQCRFDHMKLGREELADHTILGKCLRSVLPDHYFAIDALPSRHAPFCKLILENAATVGYFKKHRSFCTAVYRTEVGVLDHSTGTLKLGWEPL